MTKIVQTTASKAVVAFVAAAMLFTMFAIPAKAQTSVSDLQAQINALMAQIAALQGGSTSGSTGGSCVAIPAPLTVGAQNANVTALQNYLISAGESIPAGATGFFGPQTRSALASWQAKNGVTPAAGYYGPITAAAMAAKCVPTPPTPPTPPTTPDDDDTTTGGGSTTLRGGEGSIKVEKVTDGAISIDLGDRDNVIEVEVEAVDSDVAINRVDFEFNKRPWLYFDEVNLLVDGKEVASLSRASDFTEPTAGTWRARFSGLNLVIREDDKVEVALELVVLDSMGGNRKNETVIVTHPANGIRFVDGAGISETGGPSPVVTATVAFDDVFTDGEIRGVVSDKSPEKATIVLKESSRTDKVTILNVNLEARDSDMTIKTATTSITVSTSTTGTVFRTARLYVGNTLLKTKTVSGTGLTEVIVFDDVNYKLSKDVEREFRVEVDFNRADTIGLNKLPATFTVNAFGVVSENKNFNAHGETVPVGETHDLIVEGLVATHKSVTSSAVNDGKDVTITFKMDVTAYEKDFYINENGSNAFTYTITGPGATTTVATSTISVSGVTKNTSNNFRIQKGQTREVTVSFLVRSSAGGFVQATLDTLKYAATSTATTFPLTDTLGAPDFKVNNVSIVATPGL